MKGEVIGFDAESNTGAISGHDGNRYEFVTLDWHSHLTPHPGDPVDFVPVGQHATQIYLLEPEYIAPSFGEFYFSARGRVSRSQYWLRYFLPVLLIGLLIDLAADVEGSDALRFVSAAFQLAVLWPGIMIMVKRIHDRDKSGSLVWALYGPLIPMLLLMILAVAAAGFGAGAVAVGLWVAAAVLAVAVMIVTTWFFIEFGCMRGTVGANRFGPDPVSRA